MKTKLRRGGGRAERRTPGGRTGALALALALALPLLAADASQAANVVDVRVGRHADFTRIVFELDGPAGYRIQRAQPEAGVDELVVSLQAGATPTEVRAARTLIEGLSLESLGDDRSQARIRLSRDGLRLKEMILARPPRIVLDVLAPEPGAPGVAATATAKRAKPAKSEKAEPPAKPASTRKEPADTTPDASPALEVGDAPSASAAPEVEAPEPSVPTPAVDAYEAAAEVEVPEPAIEVGESDIAEPKAVDAADLIEAVEAAAAEEMDPTADERAEVEPLELGESTEIAMATPEPARPSPAPATPARRASTPEAGDSLFNTTNIALAAGGVLVVGLAFLFLRRRRSGAAEAGGEPEEVGEDNPFANVAAEPAAETAAEPVVEAEPVVPDDSVPDPFGLEDDAQSAAPPVGDLSPSDAPTETPLFDETPAAGDEMDTATTAIETPAPAVPPPAAGADDTANLVREMERRLASLETRLNEVVEAKERLERQVAAQNEELRVQRAAIARTQRAVRNMSRPEDDSATEPAPREA